MSRFLSISGISVLLIFVAASSSNLLRAQNPVQFSFSDSKEERQVSYEEELGTTLSNAVKPESSELKREPAEDSKSADKQALIRQGESSFQNNCLACHDAQKSLSRKKNYAGWMGTIRRMAEKDGADIPSAEFGAIATYLASLSGGNGKDNGDSGSDGGDDAADAPTTTVFGTIAPLWRGGSNELQNSGFFSDAWLGVSHSGSGPISGRVTSCMSCHNESDGGFLSRVELVEAVVRLDLNKLAEGDCKSACEPRLKSYIEAGRMIVPFGAFSQQVNPGVYRTVTKPLMFNMGQRAQDPELGDPVLPMPYADEGVNWSNTLSLTDKLDFSLDTYAVNGLQGGNGGIDFDASRDYVDNNKSPSVGGRATVGTKSFRLGSSIVGGRFNSNTGDPPFNRPMNYTIYGADASFRHKDIFRIQAEYAQRDSERVTDTPVDTFFRDHIGGYYIESELLISRTLKTSLIARYDVQSRHGPFPPPESVILDTGDFTVRRFTYGLNWNMPGGSLLMINHEHWFLKNGLSDIDVLGVRWAASF